MRITHQYLTKKFQEVIDGREDEFKAIYVKKVETSQYCLAERILGASYKQISNFYTAKEMNIYLNGLQKGLSYK